MTGVNVDFHIYFEIWTAKFRDQWLFCNDFAQLSKLLKKFLWLQNKQGENLKIPTSV